MLPRMSMRLDRLIAGAPSGAREAEITGLANDNRIVEPGTLSSASRGSSATGRSYRPPWAPSRLLLRGRRQPRERLA